MRLYLRTLIAAMYFYLVFLNISLIGKFTMPRPKWFFRLRNFIISRPLLSTFIGSQQWRSEYSSNCFFLFTSHYTTEVQRTLKILKPAGNYTLRSSAQSLLFVPEVNCSTLRDRTFAHTAPVLWNSLSLCHKNKLRSRRIFSFVGMVLIFNVKLLWTFRNSFFFHILPSHNTVVTISFWGIFNLM